MFTWKTKSKSDKKISKLGVDKMGKPIKNIRAGHVQGTVWENEGQKGTYNSVSFKKSYKDKDGKWAESTNFMSNDLADLNLVVSEAMRILKLRVYDAQQPQEEASASSSTSVVDGGVVE